MYHIFKKVNNYAALAKQIESVITVSCATSNIKIINSKEDKNKYYIKLVIMNDTEKIFILSQKQNED